MESGHGNKQDRLQEQAIAALLAEPTVEKAAKKARVAYRTLKEWLRQPEFQAAYQEARRGVLEQAVSQLLAGCTDAVCALRRNLTCGQPAPENRAAVAILEHAMKGLEALGLDQEVAELRRRLGAVEGQVDVFARIEQFAEALRHLREREPTAGGGDGEPNGGGGRGLPAGAVPRISLGELLAEAPADGAAGAVPVPDLP
jgi:hypothetical protein